MDLKEELKNLIFDIDGLISARVTDSSSEFIKWRTKTQIILEELYGKDDEKVLEFSREHFAPIVFSLNSSDEVFIDSCASALRRIRSKFEVYYDMLDSVVCDDNLDKYDTRKNDFSKVFIVHGHDGELKHKIARLLEKQNIEAIILSEQTNNGRTIIEKFEENGDVDAAICLFTADDNMKNGLIRARQNVVFETGYFIGKLGRNHIIVISENNVELPTDIQGIGYIDKKSNWEINVLKELRKIGYNIDLNKL